MPQKTPSKQDLIAPFPQLGRPPVLMPIRMRNPRMMAGPLPASARIASSTVKVAPSELAMLARQASP